MEDIKSLILKFTKPEMKYLKTLLSVFHGKSNENKMLELVELIEKKPNIALAEAAKKLYGDPKTKAFLVMKARLMERLYEVILASPSISNNPIVEEDENAYAYIQLQKDFALAIALRKRGLIELSKNILQQCLKSPHTHINLSFKVMLLEYFRTSVDNMEDLQQVNRDLEMTIPQQKLLMEARGFRDELNIAVKMKVYSNDDFIAYASKTVNYLEEIINNEIYYTPYLHFHLLWVKMDLLSAQKKANELKKVQEEIANLLLVHPLLATNNRKGIIYSHLAVSNLLLCEFRDTITNSLKACSFFQTRPYNYWHAKTLEAFAKFYLQDWNGLQEISNAFQNIKEDKYKDIEEIFLFLSLCVSFFEGNSKKVLQQISELEEAYSNKTHFNTNIRIFEIIILIELNDSYFAELKIDALRKHLERYEVLPRYLICYKILNQLQLQSFDFQKENLKIKTFLEELRTEHKWRAYSFEAIRFETWFEAMKSKTAYWNLFRIE